MPQRANETKAELSFERQMSQTTPLAAGRTSPMEIGTLPRAFQSRGWNARPTPTPPLSVTLQTKMARRITRLTAYCAYTIRRSQAERGNRAVSHDGWIGCRRRRYSVGDMP